MELSENIFTRVSSLVKIASIHHKREEYQKEIETLLKAEQLFPDPTMEYMGSEYLYSLLGDAFFEIKEFEQAGKYYIKSQNCIDKSMLEETTFGLGKVYYELKEYPRSRRLLSEIYEQTEKEYFYDEDAKYYYFITSGKIIE